MNLSYKEEENYLGLKLFKKCKKNQVEQVEELIKQKVDPNYCGDEGTPLTWAVKTSHLALVMCLLQSPYIKINQKDTGGYSPLILASMYDYKETDQSIVNNYHIIRKLLINTPGIDINIDDMAGNTPLMYCALTDNKEIVKEILMAGAEIDRFNSMGMTALHNAASINSSEVVSLLLSCGAKSIRDKSGFLPIDLTSHIQVLKLLSGKKTSISHPFKVDFIDRTLCPMLKDAKIGMSMCPGREWNSWSRDFDSDLKVVVENKVDVVASIITHTELRQMNYYDFYDKIRKFGLESIEYSIHDKWVPNSVDNFIEIVDKIVDYIRQQKNVLVHCNGGRGRTGLIVAATIIIIGYSSEQAINMVRTARTGMLRNPAQEVFLHALQSKLHSQTLTIATGSLPTLITTHTPTTSSTSLSETPPPKKNKILPLLRKQSLTPKAKRDFFSRSEQTLSRSKTNGGSDYIDAPVQRKYSSHSRLEKQYIKRHYNTPPVTSILREVTPPSSEAEFNVFSIMERAGPTGQIPLELSPVLSRRTTDED